jgi:parallel beta-helix repeat protein
LTFIKLKPSASTLILALLLSAVFATSLVSLTKANFTPLPELPKPIYIRNDGSVEPSTAPFHREGNTYLLTNNIHDTIEIQRPNTLINGNGFSLTNPAVNTKGLMIPIGWLPGVSVTNVDNVTITNILFESCITGVRVENASEITIDQNTMQETRTGIVVLSSSQINITGNDITLLNQTFATGIQFLPSNPDATNPHHIRIEGNQITGNSIQVPASPPQTEEYGIAGEFGNSIMVGNSLTKINGIAMYYTGSNNIIASNNIQNNNEGMLFSGGAALSVNNKIYGNNFNGNSENAIIPYIRDFPNNFWDNGKIGNYWSDYKGSDADSDGIGDSPYILETVYFDYELNKNVTLLEGQDSYPLMTPLDTKNITMEQLETIDSTNLLPDPTATPQEPQQTDQLIFSAVITAPILAIGLGLLIYLTKRK